MEDEALDVLDALTTTWAGEVRTPFPGGSYSLTSKARVTAIRPNDGIKEEAYRHGVKFTPLRVGEWTVTFEHRGVVYMQRLIAEAT